MKCEHKNESMSTAIFFIGFEKFKRKWAHKTEIRQEGWHIPKAEKS